jgi:hypothetical protein
MTTTALFRPDPCGTTFPSTQTRCRAKLGRLRARRTAGGWLALAGPLMLLLPGLTPHASAQQPAPPPPSDATAPPAPPPPAEPPPSPSPSPTAPATDTGSQPMTAGFMSLRLMRDKGIITEAEYQSALKDLSDTSGARAGEGLNFVVGKWSTQLYGFAEADYIYVTTQGLPDIPGNTQIARPGSYKGENQQMQFGVRNSRIGFRFRAPETSGIRASAVLEADFFQASAAGGTLAVNPTNNTTGNAYGTEQSFWSNPVLRARHYYLKLETPVVDFLFGQTWALFGWQPVYMPATVEIQGVPGEVYQRTPQMRMSKTVKGEDATFEIAIGAMRPPQSASAVPEGQAGMRLAFNKWTGMYTSGQTSTNVVPASIAVTGDLRYIRVNSEFGPNAATSSVDRGFSAIAADAFLPIVPADKDHKGNSLSILGQFAYGYGISDLFSALNGGIKFPNPPNPTGATPAPVYTPNIDPGIAVFDYKGGLHPIQWTAVLAGLQYYLPGLDGKAFLSANYSHMESANMHYYMTTAANAAAARSSLDWFDVAFMGDVTDAVRLGIEYANTTDVYVDTIHAVNHRVQGSAFYIF